MPGATSRAGCAGRSSACCALIVVIALLTAIPGAPLRDPEHGAVIGDSPFMDSLIFIITLIFLVAGICYGLGAGTIKSSVDVINASRRRSRPWRA